MKRVVLACAALLVAAAGPIRIELPFDATPYPDLGKGAPAADAINNNCLSCHSAEMVMTQPRLNEAEWAAEVAKMRNVYKAPIDPGDDAAITAWLTAMSARLPKQAG